MARSSSADWPNTRYFRTPSAASKDPPTGAMSSAILRPVRSSPTSVETSARPPPAYAVSPVAIRSSRMRCASSSSLIEVAISSSRSRNASNISITPLFLFRSPLAESSIALTASSTALSPVVPALPTIISTVNTWSRALSFRVSQSACRSSVIRLAMASVNCLAVKARALTLVSVALRDPPVKGSGSYPSITNWPIRGFAPSARSRSSARRTDTSRPRVVASIIRISRSFRRPDRSRRRGA